MPVRSQSTLLPKSIDSLLICWFDMFVTEGKLTNSPSSLYLVEKSDLERLLLSILLHFKGLLC